MFGLRPWARRSRSPDARTSDSAGSSQSVDRLHGLDLEAHAARIAAKMSAVPAFGHLRAAGSCQTSMIDARELREMSRPPARVIDLGGVERRQDDSAIYSSTEHRSAVRARASGCAKAPGFRDHARPLRMAIDAYETRSGADWTNGFALGARRLRQDRQAHGSSMTIPRVGRRASADPHPMLNRVPPASDASPRNREPLRRIPERRRRHARRRRRQPQPR